MRFSTLDKWLEWQEKLHFTEIDPGVERISTVWENIKTVEELPFTVITVAGTNGKGSSVAMLDAILRAAGFKTGTYTSPHLLKYNERICVNSFPCDDDTICQSFERIDSGRKDISLTYFEFATLAAIDIFCEQQVDIAILEVGMGGRLDAVNAFDADIALITPIGLDHTAWLGNTLDEIGFEKAGIIRQNQPVVLSELTPPQSIVRHANSLGAPVSQAGRDFQTKVRAADWSWSNEFNAYDSLPFPALAGSYQIQNAAAVIQVINLFNQSSSKTVTAEAIKQGLSTVKLAGRFQQIPGEIELIFDVTHNQQGSENLSQLLNEKSISGRTFAVIAMLKDKDVEAAVSTLKNNISDWHCAGLAGNRGMASEEIAAKLRHQLLPEDVYVADTPCQAYDAAKLRAVKGDRILIFGSFHTVEQVMRHIGL